MPTDATAIAIDETSHRVRITRRPRMARAKDDRASSFEMAYRADGGVSMGRGRVPTKALPGRDTLS
jgi:hypothetical protein